MGIYNGLVNFLFLLTPPHGGRLGVQPLLVRKAVISTHAPAWGAIFDLV